MKIDDILKEEPFDNRQGKKETLFLMAMKEAAKWHFEHCPEYKTLCRNRNFEPEADYEVTDIPYLPIAMFKKFRFASVPASQIVRTLFSSSTSGQPSVIQIDQVTMERQRQALSRILPNFLGKERRHFIIFDALDTAKSQNGELASRNTAIRGMLTMSKSINFVLNGDLELELGLFEEALKKVKNGEPVCFFGFTWLIYSTYLKNQEKISKIISQAAFKDSLVLHIGGWKKLRDIAVTKEDFNQRIGEFLNVSPSKIIDVYGMTEQLGTIYPDCEYGFKHVPLYSEIITRDIDSLEPAKVGETGFIELLSPLPHSYPGIAVLSDDIGRIVGVDDCKCGRGGKYFVFEKRSEKAELRGCGDTLKIDGE